MAGILVKNMEIKLQRGETWYRVLAIGSPFPSGGVPPLGGGMTPGLLLILRPESEPKLHWIPPDQVGDIKYELL